LTKPGVYTSVRVPAFLRDDEFYNKGPDGKYSVLISMGVATISSL